MKRFLFWMALGALLMFGRYALAADAPKPTASSINARTLKTWVHIFGCPSSTKKSMGPQHVILIFSDGYSMVLRIDTAPDDKRKLLAEFIGDLEGTNIKYECGTQS